MTCIEYLQQHYAGKVRGVIQAGAHHGEEDATWVAMGIQNRVYFEPVTDNFLTMASKLGQTPPYPTMFRMALGNFAGNIRMFTEIVNGGQSCSVLAPNKHKEILPWIEFNGEEVVPITKLDYVPMMSGDYNLLHMDVQGYELEVLKGAEKTLEHIDFIITEVANDEVYTGNAYLHEVNAFLKERGFKPVVLDWHGGMFGDVLYVRA